MFTFINVRTGRAIVALLFIIAPASAPLLAQLGLGLSPMRVELNVPAGKEQSGVITLHNDSQELARISADLMDFYLDQTGTPQFVRQSPGEKDFSCREWLSINPMETQLAGGQQLNVRYTIRVPAGTPEAGYHCAAVFGTVPALGVNGAVGIRSAVRVVGAFYVNVGAPPVNASIKNIGFEYVPDKDAPFWQALAVLENRGVEHCRPTGELEVIGQDGKVLESVPFPSLPLLPKREQTVPIPLRSLRQDQRYRLRLRIDFGMKEVLEASALVKAERQ